MKQFILNCITGQLSYNQVEAGYRAGRISARHWEAFCRVWDWTAPRFGGEVGWRHDRFWARWGHEAYLRRINRTRAAFGLPPY